MENEKFVPTIKITEEMKRDAFAIYAMMPHLNMPSMMLILTKCI